MNSKIEYSKGKIIIHPPKEFKGMDNPLKDDPALFRKFMVKVFRAVFVYFREMSFRRSRRGYNQYECAEIKERLFTKKECACDHIKPIVSLDDSENDWNGLVERSFDMDNLQILSNEAHKVKTGKENSKRFKGKKRK